MPEPLALTDTDLTFFTNEPGATLLDRFKKTLEEMDASEDARRVERGLRRFVEFLESGRMEIKVYPSAGIHAKVYIAAMLAQEIAETDRAIDQLVYGLYGLNEEEIALVEANVGEKGH